jgi:DNA (cytosine-5)-methyltransferase 1
LGYACDVYAISAVHFVPQSRPRIFVIGVQTPANQEISVFARRAPSLKTKGVETAIAANLDLHWHFAEVPDLPKKVETTVSSIVEQLSEDDDRWWSDTEVERHLQMMSSVNLDYLKGLRERSDESYCTMYRRVREGKQRAELRKDGIAGCLRTAKGGSSRQMLVQVGQGQTRMRVMTPREYARLQGVPEEYSVLFPTNQALTGFGDAVCVPVITWIATNILNPLIKSLPEKPLALHR